VQLTMWRGLPLGSRMKAGAPQATHGAVRSAQVQSSRSAAHNGPAVHVVDLCSSFRLFRTA
jgi:hypothetical protein